MLALRILVMAILGASGAPEAHAQDWASLQHQVDAHLKADRSVLAVPLARQAVKAAEQEFGAMHPNTAAAWEGLAEALRYQPTRAGYVEAWEKAKTAREASQGPDSPPAIRACSETGAAMRRVQRYPEADRLLQRCLETAETALGRDHAETIRLLEQLARLHRARGDSAAAQKWAVECATRAERHYGRAAVETAKASQLAAVAFTRTRSGQQALAYADHAVATLRKAGPDATEVLANAYKNLGDALRMSNQVERALALFDEGIAFTASGSVPNGPHHRSDLMNGKGSALLAAGRHREAVAIQREALRIASQARYDGDAYVREYGLEPREARVAAKAYWLARNLNIAGEHEEAAGIFRESIEGYMAADGPGSRGAIEARMELATALRNAGRFREALAEAGEGVRVAESLTPPPTDLPLYLARLSDIQSANNHYGEAVRSIERALGYVGAPGQYDYLRVPVHGTASRVFGAMGKHDDAVLHSRRLLELQEGHYPSGAPAIAQAQNGLGVALFNAGHYGEALSYFERAHAARLRSFGPRHRFTVESLANMATAQQKLGNLTEAVRVAEESVRITREEGRLRIAWAHLWSLGEIYSLAGRHDEAAALLREALVYATAAETRMAGMAGLKHELAVAERGRDRRDAAIFFGKLAVNDLQRLRATNSMLDPELKRSLVDRYRFLYSDLARDLVDTGRIAEAQQVMAMLKEDELHLLTRGEGAGPSQATRASYAGIERDLATRYDSDAMRVASLGREAAVLRRGGDPADRPRLQALETELEKASRAFDQQIKDILSAFTEQSARQRTTAKLDQIDGLRETLGELGEGVVLLHYLPVADRTHVIVTSGEVRLSRIAPVGEAALNRKIARFRQLLQSPAHDPRLAARDLHDLLVAPVRDDLRQLNARVVMLSLNGALRYLPFAALHDGEAHLAERYRFAMYTDAAASNLQKRPAGRWRVWALGTSKEQAGFPSLPNVKREIDGILRQVPGEAYLDDEFTEQRLREGIAKRFPVLHIASHFKFTPGTELDSFLLLGNGAPLTLDKLRHGPRFEGVDLLALSACETGFGGGRDDLGREIEGLGALAQVKGARGVMATLWPVADTSTAEFMQAFYRARRDDPAVSKAEALQRSQVAFIRDERFAHPFYWAPFILMGNWL